MKIGYPCLTRDLPFQSGKTFRLASYSEQRLIDTVAYNLDALQKILEYNLQEGLLLFRIGSSLIPFASHPVNQFPWQQHFAGELASIGRFARTNGMRLSLHPDQFTLLNSPDVGIFERSRAELQYHADILDGMEVDTTHKIQIHVGGVYGDKEGSLQRFIDRFALLTPAIQRRLVVENDDRLYNVTDCLRLTAACRTPVLLDVFHHELNGNGMTPIEALQAVSASWLAKDGIPIIDYSSQAEGCRIGTHTESIDDEHFRATLLSLAGVDCDVMLEIKDKERSALRALQVLQLVQA